MRRLDLNPEMSLSSLVRGIFYQNGHQIHSAGNMAAFMKSDPLPVPGAKQDLMKSCLPLAGAAVLNIFLKTHPRWSRHSLPVHVPLRWLSHSRENQGLIVHMSSELQGFSPHAFHPLVMPSATDPSKPGGWQEAELSSSLCI
jgi:hypothetical protein